MAFTVEDFEDLYRLLSEHPEWRTRLRPLILGDEYVQMPERLARVEAQLIRIGDSLTQHDQRLAEIDERLAAITERLDQVTTALQGLNLRMDRVEGRLGNIEGDLLEERYVRNLREWFAPVVWPVERVVSGDLGRVQASLDSGDLAPEDAAKIQAADILVRGKRRDDPAKDLLLVVEISQTINLEDVERAQERAEILKRLGYDTRAFVGGYRATTDALDRAGKLNVFVDLRRPAA